MRNRYIHLLITNDPIIQAISRLGYVDRWTEPDGRSKHHVARMWFLQLVAGNSGNELLQGVGPSTSGSWLERTQLRGNLLHARGIPSNP